MVAQFRNILETERLVLRRLQPKDIDDLFALYRDPEIRRMQGIRSSLKRLDCQDGIYKVMIIKYSCKRMMTLNKQGDLKYADFVRLAHGVIHWPSCPDCSRVP